MALTQKFPDFKLGSLPAKYSDLPEGNSGRTLAFTKHTDVGDIAESILKSGHFIVDAAPASGKSTRLPQAIASRTNKLVVHVMPFPQMAAAMATWHSTTPGQIKPILLEEVDDLVPERGYVITHVGWIVAKWLQFGMNCLSGAVVLHDESHESGAASATLRSLASEASLHAYVAMSATHASSQYRPYDPSGKIISREYSPDAFDDPWSIMEKGAPWSVDRMRGNVLIFEDDHDKARHLIEAYNSSNVAALRWTSSTPTNRFLADLKYISSATSKRVAIIADSSYRSGYTLPVESIFDSGLVKRTVSLGEGQFRSRSRRIYAGEKLQSMARGGRLPGLTTTYYVPQGELKNAVCMMEQTDIEAYVLITRMLGYKCLSEYPGARFHTGNVPKELCEALNNDVPLASMDPDLLCPIEQSVYDWSEHLFENENVPESIEDEQSAPFSFDQLKSQLQGLYVSDEMPEPAKIGEPILESGSWENLEIRDVETVLNCVRGYVERQMIDNVILYTWSAEDLRTNFSLVASRYNQVLMRYIGLALALKDMKEDSPHKDPVAMSKWARQKYETLILYETEMNFWFDASKRISEGRISFSKGPPLDKAGVEQVRSENMFSFQKLPGKIKALDSTKVRDNTRALGNSFKSKLLEL